MNDLKVEISLSNSEYNNLLCAVNTIFSLGLQGSFSEAEMNVLDKVSDAAIEADKMNRISDAARAAAVAVAVQGIKK